MAFPRQVGGETLPQVEESKYLVQESGKNEAQDRRADQCGNCNDAVTVANCHGNKGAKPKGNHLFWRGVSVMSN